MAVFFFIHILAAMLLPLNAVEVRSSFITDNILGQTAILQCSWNVNDNPTMLFFYRNFSNILFRCDLAIGSCSSPSGRLNTNTTAAAVGSISMIINKLECSDEGVYKCQLYKLLDTNNYISESTLNLTVPPTLPKLSNFQASVQENNNITATCEAILGYPTPLQIVWKTFGYSSDLSSELVVTTVNITQADKRCAVSTQSTVYLKASRAYKNLTLACFVTNQDSQPESCNNQTSLCSQTSSVNVLYSISNVQLRPPGTLYEGNTVTLSCSSDGNPPPTYTWTKVGDENTTLTGVMDGSSSTLTLTNLNISDSGIYNCTASNTVFGVTKVFSDVVNIIVFPPTTTTSTTTMTTTTKKSTLITSTTSPGTNPADASTGTGDSDKNAIIIGVVVGVGGALIIAIIIAIVCYRRKSKPKSIVDEPAEKSYNNNTPYNINLTNANMNYKNTQPDLVANEKKMNSSSLNSSFDLKNDGLSYADLTYDNRPRSRKPMAITDTSSVYSSEVQMPEV